MKRSTYGFLFLVLFAYMASSTYFYMRGKNYQELYSFEYRELAQLTGKPADVDMVHSALYFDKLPKDENIGLKIVYADDEAIFVNDDSVEELNRLGKPSHIYKYIKFGQFVYMCPLNRKHDMISALKDILSYHFRCTVISERIS